MTIQLKKPLQGLLVIDFTQSFSGPLCTQIMANNGARVLKIERTQVGDMLRGAAPFNAKGESLFFASTNIGKESVEFNLKSEEDLKIIKNILKKADILVENFRPGVMDRLDLSYEKVSEINPGIIYTSISGYGHTGPMKKEPGLDLVLQGLSGLMSITGKEGIGSERVGTTIGDISAGMWAYMATLTALHARTITGKGTHADISMLDSVFSLMMPTIAEYTNTGIVANSVGNIDPAAAPFGVVKAKDGYMIVAILGDNLWKTFCEATDSLDLQDDKKFKTNKGRIENRMELRSFLRPKFKLKTVSEWEKIFKKYGMPFGFINNIKNACEMEQIKARNMLCKAGQYILCGNPIKYNNFEDAYEKCGPPKLGEHNEKVKNEFK